MPANFFFRNIFFNDSDFCTNTSYFSNIISKKFHNFSRFFSALDPETEKARQFILFQKYSWIVSSVSFNLICGFRRLQFKLDALHCLDARHPWRSKVTRLSPGQTESKFPRKYTQVGKKKTIISCTLWLISCYNNELRHWTFIDLSWQAKRWKICVVCKFDLHQTEREPYAAFTRQT